MALRLVAPPSAELSDDDLVLGIRSGDERALTLLYKRYARYVAGIAFRMMGSEDEVDDIVQQVFFETARLADKVEHVRSWLYRLATRQVSRRLKRRWRRGRLSAALGWLVPRSSNPTHARGLDELYEALDAMSPDLRVPWSLHHVEGRTVVETAEACGLSPATVKRRLARAEGLMQKRWGT
jgi:RNA polymerase sigma-70 factor (ECF subfamily)